MFTSRLYPHSPMGQAFMKYLSDLDVSKWLLGDLISCLLYFLLKRFTDRPKLLNLHLLNSGTKDVQIMSVRATPSNDAITIDFKAVTLKAGEHRYTKVASISFDGK